MDKTIIGCAPNKFYILTPILLNIFINLVFVILDTKKILSKKDKNKITSLHKFLFPLSILEIFVYFIWSISGFLPYEKKEREMICRSLGMLQIFFYTFELIFIHGIISHLKHLILNPLKYILKSNQQLIKSLIINFVISIIIAFCSLRIAGKSPIATCFFNYKIFIDGHLGWKIIFIIILMLPLFVILHIIYKISIVIRSNSYENDKKNKELFKTHIYYLSSYLLIYLFFPILYLPIAIRKENSNEIFNFIITLIIVLIPLITGIFRVFKSKLFKKKVLGRSSISSNKEIILLDIPEENEEEEEEEEVELFEASAIKKFVMNFYISVCFCLEKNRSNALLIFRDLNDDMNKETNIYTISKDTIYSELSNGDLIKDSMVNSREKFSITCIEYAPKIFSYLRESDDVSEEMIIKSMLPRNNSIGIKETEGKGGSFFINSDDHEFIIKTITEKEFKMMLSLLNNKMVDYFKKNKSSLICRIYGVYKISIPTGLIKNDEIYFILMKNVIGSFSDNLICKYDLKGSSLNRKVTYENMDKNVMKDLNFNEMEEALLLNKDDAEKLLKIVEKDTDFLCSLGIMDYSLLVAKISLNNYEIASLFGKDHRKKSERNFLKMIGKENNNSDSFDQSKDKKDNPDEEDTNLLDQSDKIRFKEGNISSLKKYMFPSLKADVMYMMSIIDYFQEYTLQKNLENTYKKFRAGVRKEEISSLPPKEYRNRLIEFIKRKTDSEHYLQDLLNPANKNDF